ncbi:hypothetical protein LIA77_06333 [Sarocladium implicatum]|nr:hypothetical protein LIA77_06333 [Sarocladium implicatum]
MPAPAAVEAARGQMTPEQTECSNEDNPQRPRTSTQSSKAVNPGSSTDHMADSSSMNRSCPCGGKDGPAYFNYEQGVALSHADVCAVGYAFREGIKICNRVEEQEMTALQLWSLDQDAHTDTHFKTVSRHFRAVLKSLRKYRADCVEGLMAVSAIHRASCDAPGAMREADCGRLLTWIWEAQRSLKELDMHLADPVNPTT